MCGIAGVIKFHDPKDATPPPPLVAIPEEWLDVLDESIKHRGPDGQGRFRDRAVREDGTIVDVALVHRRLSIIDHEGGHQPMVHDGERLRPDLTYQPGENPIVASEVEPGKPLVAVVFNGCIYNHRELRKELESDGFVFETDHSDTEVLVHGWRAWNHAIIESIADASMFSLMIWDRTAGQLRIGRDFFGQKPLYHGTEYKGDPQSVQMAIFGSNMSGVSMVKDKLIPDSKAVATWATFGHGLGKGPMVGVGHLDHWSLMAMPGDNDPPEQRRAEKPPRVLPRRIAVANYSKFLKKSAADLDYLLRQRVEERLEADVPVACLLSGGVDSSLISSYAHQHLGNLTTITVRMPDPRYDESGHAERVASHLGTNHVVVDVQPNAAEDLVSIIESAGLPFGDSSLLPTYWACRAASEHAGVLLTGDGGDELFVGYQRYFASRKLETTSIFTIIPAMLFPLSILPRRSPVSNWTKASRMIEAYRRSSYEVLLAIFPPSDIKKLLGKNRYRFDWMDAEKNPWDAALSDLDFQLPSDYLRKVDLASMMAGVETRAPFLDRRVYLAALQLNRQLIMEGKFLHCERPKGFLRMIARKYLPKEIVDRPKQGFAIPVGEWFRSDFGGMRQLLHDHMNSSEPFPGLGDAGVEINMKFVQRMMREHDAAGEKSINPWHGRDHSQRLYMMLVLSIWAKWLERASNEPVAQASRL